MPEDSNSVANALNCTDRKYFAYVTFVNCLGAHDALNQRKHEIHDRQLCVEEAFSWHQPNIELITYAEERAKENVVRKYNKYIYEAMDKGLNNDCIHEIMTYLSTAELSDIAKFSQRFADIAHSIRKLSIAKYSDLDSSSVSLMDLRALLRLQGFGHSIKSLKLSMNVIKTQRSVICARLMHYLGPQLSGLSLLQFGLTTEQFEQFKPLFARLSFLDVDLNYRFDYAMFNDSWPHLETLRVKSQGVIQLVDPLSSKTPNFSNVKSLAIASSYKLHENVFSVIATHFPNLRELAVIVIDDYYTELTRMSGLNDLHRIKGLQCLNKLHLSLSRMYLTDSAIETLTELKTVEDFTLEVNGNRTSSGDATIENLKGIVVGMPLLRRFRMSNIQIADEKIVEIVKVARNLRSLGIHNNGYTLTTKTLDDLVSLLRDQRRASQFVPSKADIFELIVDQMEEKLKKVRFKI